MATLEKISLAGVELSNLRKIQDSFLAEKAILEKKLSAQLMTFWAELRIEHNLGDVPFHVMGENIWLLRDASDEEINAFLKMTNYK